MKKTTTRELLTRRLRMLVCTFVAISLIACSQENNSQERNSDQLQQRVQADAYLDIAEVYAAQGQFRSAFIEIQNALQIMPGYEQALLSLARINLDIGDVVTAIDVLTSMQEQGITTDEVVLTLSEAYLLSNDPDSALEQLSNHQFQDSSSQSSRDWVRGNAFALAGNREEAEQAFQSALSAEPEHIPSLIGLSRLAFAASDLTQARQYLETALTMAPNDLDLLIWQGDYASLNGQYPEAEQAYNDALEIMGSWDLITAKRFAVLQAIQVPLQMQNKDQEALQYAQIIADTPQGQYLNTFSNAFTQIQEGDYQSASDALSNILSVAPDNPQANILLGISSYALGDYSAAVEAITNYADLESASLQVLQTLAASYLELNDPISALPVLSLASERFPEDSDVMALRGLAYQRMGSVEEAIDAYRQALQIQPDNNALKVPLAESYMQAGNGTEAVTLLTEIIDSDPEMETAKTALVNYYLRQNDPATATALIDEWLAEDADSAVNNFLAGNTALAFGNVVEARGYYDTALDSNPENLQIRMQLTRLAVSQQDFDEAQTQIDSMLSREPTNADVLIAMLSIGNLNNTVAEKVARVEQIAVDYPAAHVPPYVLAQFFMETGDLERAQEFADQALSRNRNQVTLATAMEVILRRADQAVVAENLELAEQLVATGLDLADSDFRMLTAAAHVAHRQGNDALVQEYIENIRAIDPASAVSWEVAGDLQMLDGNSVQAVEIYREGWEVSQASGLAAKLYQVLNNSQGRTQATEFLDQWLNELPQDGTANLLRGMEFQDQNETVQAQQHYEIALTSLPNNIVLLNNLAWLEQDDNPERALQLAARAASLAPQNPDILDTYGWILYQQGYQTEAVDTLRRAQELAPEHAEIAEHLEAAQQ